MAKEEADGSGKKEAAVLSDTSLTNLGKELGAECVKVAMYLNIPTVTIVNIQLKCKEKQQTDADTAVNMILQWKLQRETAKDKDKVSELEKALRDCQKADMADAVLDKFKDNAELTPEALR